MTDTTDPVPDAIALLEELAAERAAPDAALARLRRLRERHPRASLDLVWDDEPLSGTPRYVLLVTTPERGTITLGLTASDEVPFPLRGAQRWKEADLVSVNGRRLWLHEAMVMVDSIWGDASILQRLIDTCLVRRELENDPIAVSDDELAAAVLAFRTSRGLFTPEATQAWLDARGLTLAALEGFLEEEVATQKLRRRVVPDAARVLETDPARFDDVSVAAFPVSQVEAAAQFARAIDAGEPFLAVAERALDAEAIRSGGARAVIFDVFARAEVTPLAGQELTPGRCAPMLLRGAGPYVGWVRAVRAVRPASAAGAAAERIERRLFEEWLAEQRARARIEWSWGRDR